MATTNELTAARAFLDRNFPDGGRVLCAVSGGLDSMCLLDFMAQQEGFTVAAAHFNHRLRGENGDRDEEFVRTYCRARDIPCLCGRGDTRALAEREGLSVEEAARKLRYAFLEQAAAEGGFDAILTAHHADDNAETMLLNLIRGTGARGLTGIPQLRGRIARPFLRLCREELALYAEKYGVPHVEDETNEMDDAARNVLRHRVLPVLRELNPRAVENMARTAELAARDDGALTRAAEGLLRGGRIEPGQFARLPVSACDGQAWAVLSRAVRTMMAGVSGHQKDLSAVHVEAVLGLLWSLPGKEVSLPYGLTARREDDVLCICRKAERESVPLRLNCPVEWGDYTLTLLDHREGEGLALRPGGETITVSPCDPGGRLTLPGTHGGSRSVKRLCLDRRISLAERDRLPAIYCDAHLAAVWRLGVDAAFRWKEGSVRFVQVTKTNRGVGI